MELVHRFISDISDLKPPDRFTFPFYYSPHPLAVEAANEVKEYLIYQKDWEHNFGIDLGKEGLVIGKMFGVLVVEMPDGSLGYLKGFSGKLANSNHISGFVPPVFDMLKKDSFFLKEESVLNAINAKIDFLEKEEAYLQAVASFQKVENLADQELKIGREKVKEGKKRRKKQRAEAQDHLSSESYIDLEEKLREESIASNYRYRDLTKYWTKRVEEEKAKLSVFQNAIEQLREERKKRSSALQNQLFNQYTFLNQKGNERSLLDIFKETISKLPPAGAGECAAPKLLQYAFKYKLKPICMAEFWWGESPSNEVRKSGSFYPACRGKCEPILGHMLSETETDENPMLINPAEGKVLQFIYEDDAIAVISKPAEFLSVPGKNISDSVLTRVQSLMPQASGPLVVHRLDMSTSGIMLIAKTEQAHKILQSQFIKRSIRKRYTAILEGIVEKDSGEINLPLRVDLNDRPRQLICYEHGKPAKTTYQVISRTEEQTQIQFYPVTGRTHQLRVHAAHKLGLGCPIKGDDLYGQKGERLHLHADWIAFTHPITREKVEFKDQARF